MAVLRRKDIISMMTKEMLAESMLEYKGIIDAYMNEIREKHFYIEVQLWNDEYC